MAVTFWWAGGGAFALLFFGFRYWGYLHYPFWFRSGALGTATPEDFGVAYQEVHIASGRSRLAAWWVPAPAEQASGKAVIIYHGNQEALSDWAEVVARLHGAGHGVLVFDYSGFGNSSGRPTPHQLRRDAWAVFHRARELAGPAARIYLLGFSLGAAVLMDSLARESWGAAGMILVGAYSRVRDLLPRISPLPRWAAFLFPNLQDNLRAIAENGLPTLLVHSTDDEVVPVAQARRLAEESGPEVRLEEVSGPGHTDFFRDSRSPYWPPVLAFLER